MSNELRRQTQKRDRNQWIKPQPRQAAGYFVRARYEAGLPPFFAGTHWTFPAPPELIKAASENFDDPNSYPVDACGLACHYAYIGIKRLGAGQFYLIKDKDGENYDGGEIYRLHVPPNVPIEQYWSLTVYDRHAHALVKNVDRASRASNSAEVKKDADGSVDIYLGPKAPAGEFELDSDRPGSQVRANVPPVRAEEGVLRQGVGAPGPREGRRRNHRSKAMK